MSYAVRNDGLGFRSVKSPEECEDGEAWSEMMPVIEPEIGAFQVDIERDRRISAGVLFSGVEYQSRPQDLDNIAGAAQIAFMAIMNGVDDSDLRWASDDSDFTWIASDNTLVPMDAKTMIEFAKHAASVKQALIFSGRAIKNMSPIPADFKEDHYWE